MKINDIEIEEMGGKFVSFHPSFPSVVTNIAVRGISHIDNGIELGTKKKELVLVFDDELLISNLASVLVCPFKVDQDDGYIYDCILSGEPEIDALGMGVYKLSCPTSTICKKPLVTQTTSTFNVDGNTKSYCTYEITSTVALASVTVDGYTIKNLKANKTFIIDGIDKLVYYKDTPNLSAFDDTDIIKFPSLEPGTHTIQKSANVMVVVKYYPIFL